MELIGCRNFGFHLVLGFGIGLLLLHHRVNDAHDWRPLLPTCAFEPRNVAPPLTSAFPSQPQLANVVLKSTVLFVEIVQLFRICVTRDYNCIAPVTLFHIR
jgi:hypothetical protein